MIRYRRLGSRDARTARRLFATMAGVFAEPAERIEPRHLARLLQDRGFWAIAALDEETVVGGLTGYVLPMTRAKRFDFFLYDIAVVPDRQREGVGRGLVKTLQTLTKKAGISEIFILAENEDRRALRFYRAFKLKGSPVATTMFTLNARTGD